MFFALAIAVESTHHHHHHHVHKHREVANASGKQIAELAKTRVGCPYEYKGVGPDTFDNLGLIKWVFHEYGIGLPKTINRISKHGLIGRGNEGDVVCFGSPAYHIGIYIGNGQCVHVPKPWANMGKKVIISRVMDIDDVVRYRRIN